MNSSKNKRKKIRTNKFRSRRLSVNSTQLHPPHIESKKKRKKDELNQ